MNILIPLGGKGERFLKEGFIDPKPLIKVFNKTMIEYVIDNLSFNQNDKIFIIYNKYLNEYKFCEYVKNKYPHIELIELEKDTSGAAETVYIGLHHILQNLEHNKKTILLDCDTFYTEDVLELFRNTEHNAVFYTTKENELPIYSYIELDINSKIVKIAEKQKISNNANTGAYAFNDITELFEFSKQIVEGTLLFNNERYTSCIIHKMLEKKSLFIGIELQNKCVFSLGTPTELKKYVDNCYAFLFDLDGTLVISDEIYINAWTELLEPYGITLTKEIFNLHIQGNNDMHVAKTLLPNTDIDVPNLSSNKDRLFLKNLDKIIIIDGAIEILREVKKIGHKCAIVTNCNRIVAEKIVKKMGINSMIDFIISNNDCKNSKPHPEPYLNALKQYGITNKNTFIFEDSKTGISSGKSIYPKCLIGVETLYDSKELLNSGCNISIKNYSNFNLDLLTSYNNVSIDKIKKYIKNSYIAHVNTELVDVIIDDNKLKGGYIGDVISITLIIKNNQTLVVENIECVLKLENKNETSLSAMATKLQLYEREYYFYESVSKYVNINIPRFYCLVKDDMLNNYGILMENLFKTGNHKLNLNLNDNSIDISLKIIEKMSNMHVKFWDKDLTKNFTELKSANSPMFLPFWKNFIDEKWDNFQNKWQTTLSADDLLLGQTIVDNFKNIQLRLSSCNLTIIHGDIKSPNIFYNIDKNNDPIFLDWQHILIGKGVQDLIFFVIESFDIKNIKILYPIFKNYYYKKLVEQGIKNYSYDEYNQDIKDSISYVPFYTAIWFGTVPYDDLIDKNFPFFFIQKLFYLLKIIF